MSRRCAKNKKKLRTHTHLSPDQVRCVCTFVVPFSLFMSVDGACHTSPSLAARSYACDWRTYVCSSAPPPHLFLFHSLVAFIDDHAVSLSTCGLALDECKLEQRAALATTTPPPTCSSVERETKENASTTPRQTKRTTGGVFPEALQPMAAVKFKPAASPSREAKEGGSTHTVVEATRKRAFSDCAESFLEPQGPVLLRHVIGGPPAELVQCHVEAPAALACARRGTRGWGNPHCRRGHAQASIQRCGDPGHPSS